MKKINEISFRRLFKDYLTEDEINSLLSKYLREKELKFENLFLECIDEKCLNKAKNIILSKKLSKSEISEIKDKFF